MQKCFVNFCVPLGPGSECSGLPWVPGLLLSPQGADDLVSPDSLSTVREMDVANFRRVPRMPIYGTAQPSAKVTTPGALVCLWGGGTGRVEPFH